VFVCVWSFFVCARLSRVPFIGSVGCSFLRGQFSKVLLEGTVIFGRRDYAVCVPRVFLTFFAVFIGLFSHNTELSCGPLSRQMVG